MKKILSIILLVSLTSIQAQFWKDDIRGNGKIVTRERTIDSFDKLYVTGSFEVELLPGNPGKLQVTTDENLLQVIETYVKGGKLYIKINSKFNLRRYTKLHISLPTQALEKISVTGSATIFAKNTLDWQFVKLSILGGGNMDFSINSTKISVSVTGSGSVTLEGKTKNSYYKVTGSGSVIAKNITSQYAKASVTGSGEITLQAPTDKIDASVTGSGTIYYYGEPEIINSKTLGSGSIIQR